MTKGVVARGLSFLDELGWLSPSRVAGATGGFVLAVAFFVFTLVTQDVPMIAMTIWVMLVYIALGVRAWRMALSSRRPNRNDAEGSEALG